MSGIDRISELPESLLTKILSYVPTKQSVQTSVLSKIWKNMYLSVPVLDFNCSVIPDEVILSFFDKLLEFSPESSLFNLKVKCRDTMMDGFKDRIGTMINRGTQHLNVESSIYYYEDDNSLYPIVDMMPKNLLTSKTLLLSGCPVLEDLTLLRNLDDDYAIGNDEFKVMRVRSRSLKRFSVLLRKVMDYRPRVEIDAPVLEHMSLGEDQFDSIVVKNLTSLLMAELDIKFFVEFGVLFNTWNASKSNDICDFLNRISEC
ncbi:FBD-associated F-box protein [Raphanus sativus]|nr:FBD-associated F-box protein [Raphanus sativus]